MNVIVNNNSSGTRPVLSGVPQGSVIGPLLFLLYVNNITHSLSCPTNFFADDLKLYIQVKTSSIQEIHNNIMTCQNDINILSQVTRSWGLKINSNKCVVLHFQRHSVEWEHAGIPRTYFLELIISLFLLEILLLTWEY